MRNIGRDLRYAVRVLLTHPGTTLVALLSLGVGVGVSSTMFSLVDGMYLRPLPVRDPDGLVWVTLRSAEGRSSPLSWIDYLEVRKSVTALADAAVQNRRGGQLDGGPEPETVMVTIVSDNYFPLLGVEPAVGRLFREDLDSAMTNEPALAISDSLWRRRFGGDPSLVGRAIRMNGRSFTVVGVLPPEFRGLNRGVRNDVWVPTSTWKTMGGRREFEDRGPGQFEVLARSRSGASLALVAAQLEALTGLFQQEQPDAYRRWRLAASTEADRRSPNARLAGLLLLAVVGLVVLIACSNVAMLLLAQAEGRSHEVSIRLAVGAGRWRLVRQLLTEASVLAVAGGLVAIVAAAWLIPLLPALLPPGPDFMRFDIRLDRRVLGVTFLTCVVSVFLFGLAPALRASRVDLISLLKGKGGEFRRRYAGRNMLAITQASLAVVLLVAAGLMARSFLHTRAQPLGLDTNRQMIVVLTANRGLREKVATACEEIASRIGAVPGVKHAAWCRRMPLIDVGSGAVRDVVVPGHPATAGEAPLRIRYNQVSPNYFAVTGTRILAGRTFSSADTAGTGRVALVNETMARRFWGGGAAVEQSIRVDNSDVRIVGVVEDCVINRIHENPEPYLYFPYAQLPASEATFLAETTVEADTRLDTVKREIRASNPDVVVLLSSTLRQQLRDALYADWLPALLSATVGVIGIALAAAGLYGVVLQGVNHRYREMGIRMALGAGTVDLMVLVLGRGLLLAGIGAGLGAAASLGVGRLVSSLLYGISPYDPLVLTGSILMVMTVAFCATLYPAWRAARVDPAAVLRAE